MHTKNYTTAGFYPYNTQFLNAAEFPGVKNWIHSYFSLHGKLNDKIQYLNTLDNNIS